MNYLSKAGCPGIPVLFRVEDQLKDMIYNEYGYGDVSFGIVPSSLGIGVFTEGAGAGGS